MLQVTINDKNVDLPNDLEIAVTLTSPIFSEVGSSSLPYKIARSKRNQQTLGFPDRLAAATIGGVNYPTKIKCDGVVLAGMSEITDQGDETEMALKINEGAFWEWAKDTKMNELSFPEDPFTGTVENKMAAWTDRIQQSVNKTWPEEYFTCFPVVVSRSVDVNGATEFRLLNTPNFMTGYPVVKYIHTPYIGLVDFSPFIYLNAAVSLIFQSYGIRIAYNFLETISEFNRMAIINNATMPIREGKLHWNELLPSNTINDFISWIEGKFPVHFAVDMNKREASISSIEGICLKSDPIVVNGELEVITEDARPLSITSEHYSSDYAKPAEFSEEFLENLPFTIVTNWQYLEDKKALCSYVNAPDYVNYPNIIIRLINTNCYYFVYWKENTAEPEKKWEYIVKLIGSMDYDMESSAENAIKLETSFCLPTMEMPYLRQQIIVGGEPKDANLRTLIFPVYEVKLKDFVTDFFELKAYDDSVNFIPALATYRGKHVMYPLYNGDNNSLTTLVPWGSPYLGDSYNQLIGRYIPNIGNLFTDNISLSLAGERGLYETFWKFYANIYINSAKPVKITKGLQAFKNPRFDRLYRIDDTNVLLNEVKQTLTNTGIRVEEVTAYTVKHYE